MGVLDALTISGTIVRAFDPTSLALTATFTPAIACRALAVNAAGELFGVSFGGTICHFSSSGALLVSLFGASNGADVDLLGNGTIVVSTTMGAVMVTDEPRAGKTSFMLQGQTACVAFTTPPAIAATGVCMAR